ncbi:hypothetical protein B0H11DRAFT_2230137 [Mycena galericulata]|nr:hypothetical protein B0H11DRAFT_2230137 [Mycena galericulata]
MYSESESGQHGGSRAESDDEWTADSEIVNHPEASTSSVPPIPSVKRGPGRPKGSRNKTPGSQTGDHTGAKPRGRPRGTGPKQLARAQGVIESEQPKRPVGRPPKLPPARQVSIRLGTETRTVRGTPAVIRSKNLANATEGSQFHEIFNKSKPSAPSTTPSTTPNPRPVTITGLNPTDTVPDSDEDEHDEYSGLLDDGLGLNDDDDEGIEPDEGEDRSETIADTSQPRPSQPRPSPHPVPDWIQLQFEAKVRESAPRGDDGLPLLYREHKTFWFPVEDPFFSLRDNIELLTPQSLYQASFFLWDPAALLPLGDRIKFPKCKFSGLTRDGYLPRPRRCVDLDRTFWIIGYRYRCPTCVNPKSLKRTVTFRSWDSRVVRNLPRALAACFPAMLTARSGISETVFMFMRSCFQSGMGAKQFSDALRVRHLENYDKLHVQYLSIIARGKEIHEFCGKTFSRFPAFEDTSSDGYHGFTPSSQWLRDLFDKFIEFHRLDFDQAIALLTALICAIDHSFKLAKHIAKVNGEQVFIALLTITNEKGEIRVCNLVATKSHSQFELALNRMRESLERYGHDQPEIFYTDNMADKDFLERCFPSLREAVISVEKYAHLPPLEIPSNIATTVLKDARIIDEIFRGILQDLSDDDESQQLVLFLDSEWKVETSDRGYVTGRGATAVLQIEYGNNIYIIQICPIIAGGKLPLQLRNVLANPRILKVGRAVSSDLKYLQESCNSPDPFVGAVDLAHLAKDRLVITSAKTGLADLCAKILGKRIDKNVAERVSSAWEGDLSKSQVLYAALDVHACRCIYDVLIKISVPAPLPDPVALGTPIVLFHDTHSRLIARGNIIALNGSHDSINITRTRALIEVTEVIVPAAVITTHGRQTLSQFGPVPFKVVCLRSHLRLSSMDEISLPSITTTPPTPPPPLAEAISVPPSVASPTEPGLGTLIEEELNSAIDQDPAALKNFAVDPESQQEGRAVLAAARHNWAAWKTLIRSRVIKDPFHIFNMFYISVVHGLRVEFARALRDAIFIPDPVDKARIIAWGLTQSPPRDWNTMLRSSPAWIWRRCKRIIPPPEELYPLVANVFETFGHLKDAKTGLPLFNSAAWAVAKNVLELIQKGFVSDPPGISLYYLLKIESKTGLPLYRCIRGTNFTEGGVHTHLRSRLPTSGASIWHVNACLKDFILRHNLIVGTFNSTGKRYRGHYSIWLINELEELLSYTEAILSSHRETRSAWVNGNLYQPTDEVSGVLPIPEDIRLTAGMAKFEPAVDSSRPHHHLASLQGTRKAVLPVHNKAEKDLFRELMSGSNSFGNFSSSKQVDSAVKIWNAKADAQDDIYYKLAEQLKVYYTGDSQTTSNVKQTKAMTASVRAPLMSQIYDPKRLAFMPPVPETTLKPHHVPHGMLSLEPLLTISPEPTPGPDKISYSGLSSGTSDPATIATTQFAAGSSTTRESDGSVSTPQSSPSQDTVLKELAKRRVDDSMAHSEPAPKKPRHGRTCRKCYKESCPGKKSVKSCRNKCRDCDRVDCKGRNPKFPTKSCTEAVWN